MVVTADPDRVRATAAERRAFYDAVPSYRSVLDREGAATAAEPADHANGPGCPASPPSSSLLCCGGCSPIWWPGPVRSYANSGRSMSPARPRNYSTAACCSPISRSVCGGCWWGLLIAVTVGVPLGLLLGLHAATEHAVAPVVQFLRMNSPLSWAPIAVALFGIGNQPVIFLVAAASVWPIVLNTAAGVRAIDPGLLLVARSFGATRREQLSAVVLPAIRGQVQTGFRVALGIAWVVLVPAEMLGVRSGLGYQILNARDQLAYDQVMAVIVVIGIIGYALDSLARIVFDRR